MRQIVSKINEEEVQSRRTAKFLETVGERQYERDYEKDVVRGPVCLPAPPPPAPSPHAHAPVHTPSLPSTLI